MNVLESKIYSLQDKHLFGGNYLAINSVIESVGVEYECGISNTQLLKVKEFFEHWGLTPKMLDQLDRSVVVPRPEIFQSQKYSNWRSDAEITLWSTKKIDIVHFLQRMHKAGAITNHTCGMHVHFGFKNKARAIAVFSSCSVRLKFDELYKQFSLRGIGGTHIFDSLFYNRLDLEVCHSGCNQSNVYRQLIATNHHALARYRQINLASLSRIGTIEVRILPGVPYPYNKEALDWLIKTMTDLYNTYKNNPAVLKHYAALLFRITPTERNIPRWLAYDSKIIRYYRGIANHAERSLSDVTTRG